MVGNGGVLRCKPDHRSERFVNAAIKKMNITRVIIAHRETTLRTVDRIISI